ncbi:MAG: hypothetical protein WBG71_03055 [Leeuwenhoekiella sp.]
MNFEERKYRFIERFVNEVNEDSIEKYENLLDTDTEDREYPPIFYKLLEQSEREAERGESIPHEEAMKRIREKLNLKV